MTGISLRRVLEDARSTLAGAEVPSPRADAEQLAAHVLGLPRGKLATVSRVEPEVAERIGALARARASRVPLQHLTGEAALGDVTVAVGPGIFVPRPETEQLLLWGLALLADRARPTVVDLCTGSGALALAVANARPDARVHAVERDPIAFDWARHNAESRLRDGDTAVVMRQGDVADPSVLAELNGRVDLVLCNPPYVPEGADVAPEVAEHDPHEAVFAGDGGLTVVRYVVACAARLLRPGGGVAIEHDDRHGRAAPDLFRPDVFHDVTGHTDLAGRPRFATALRRED